MYTIQLNMDDSIFDKYMGLLDKLPKDKLEIVSNEEFPDIPFEKTKQKVEKAVNDISSNGFNINELLKEHDLSHFKYYEEESRIVYTRDTGTPVQKHDFVRLRALLKEHNIKYTDIGLDVLMIEND